MKLLRLVIFHFSFFIFVFFFLFPPKTKSKKKSDSKAFETDIIDKKCNQFENYLITNE
jgi:hypothetical protein